MKEKEPLIQIRCSECGWETRVLPECDAEIEFDAHVSEAHTQVEHDEKSDLLDASSKHIWVCTPDPQRGMVSGLYIRGVRADLNAYQINDDDELEQAVRNYDTRGESFTLTLELAKRIASNLGLEVHQVTWGYQIKYVKKLLSSDDT